MVSGAAHLVRDIMQPKCNCGKSIGKPFRLTRNHARRAINPRWPRMVRRVFILDRPSILASRVVGYSATVPPCRSSLPIISAIPRKPGSRTSRWRIAFRRYTRKQLV